MPSPSCLCDRNVILKGHRQQSHLLSRECGTGSPARCRTSPRRACLRSTRVASPQSSCTSIRRHGDPLPARHYQGFGVAGVQGKVSVCFLVSAFFHLPGKVKRKALFWSSRMATNRAPSATNSRNAAEAPPEDLTPLNRVWG